MKSSVRIKEPMGHPFLRTHWELEANETEQESQEGDNIEMWYHRTGGKCLEKDCSSLLEVSRRDKQNKTRALTGLAQ